jgi:hypothetical protein
VCQPERFEQQRRDRVLIRQARDLLDDPPGQVVSGLAVGGAGAWWRDQLQLIELPT